MTITIELDKKTFLEATSKASSFTEKGKTNVVIEFTEKEAVIKGADSELNEIYFANYPMDVENPICKTSGPVTLNLTPKLESIVKALPKNEVTLVVEVGNVQVKQGKTKANVAVPVELPEVTIPSGDAAEALTLSKAVLSTLADATVFATSTKESRPPLKGVRLHSTEAGFEVVGTDSFRLGRYLLPQQINFPEMTIPAQSIKQVLNLFDEDAKIDMIPTGSNYVLFAAEDQKIYVRLIEGTYPNTSALINQTELENAKKYKVATKDVLDALKLIGNISSDNDANVFIIKPTESGLEFSALSSSGNVEVDVAAEFVAPFDAQVSVNLKYFKEAVLSHKKDELVIHLVSSARPLFIMSKNAYITQLVLPVRTA